MGLRESMNFEETEESDSGIESLGPEPEKGKGTTKTGSGIETRGLREQIDIFKPLFRALISSKIGLATGTISILFFLFIFLSISYLGGILAGIVSVIIVLLILIYALLPYFDIETINPASKGIPQFLGKRIETYILNEGAVAVVRNVPIIGDVFGYIPIHIGTVDIDFKDVKIYDENNFDLDVSGSFSIEADPNELIKFYNRGGAHGLDNEGKTVREKEGEHGIVDLLLGMIRSSLLKEAGKLDYSKIIKSRASLENEALKKMTMDPDADVTALNPNEPYCIPGTGTNILTFLISGIEAGEKLQRIITKEGEEKAERTFGIIDAKTAGMLYQAATGITDEELKNVSNDVLEDFYLSIKIIDQANKEGSNVKLGEEMLKLRGARFLDNINLENIGDILSLLSKLKGGKKE